MAGRVAIERFLVVGAGPAENAGASRLKASVERLDVRRLAQAIGDALCGLDDADPRVIRIRRLEVALEGARIDDPDLIARQVAQGLSAAISRIASGVPTGNAMISPSPAARLADLILALARGEAWDRWWFSDFEGVASLPVSSAIRVVLLRDAAPGLAALGLLGPADRNRVAQSLSGIDAEILFDALADALHADDDPADWLSVFELPPPPSELDAAQAAVHALAHLVSITMGAPGRASAPAIRLRVALVNAGADAAARAIASRGPKSLRRLAPAALDGDIAALCSLPAAARREIAERISRRATANAAPVSAYTRFGGLLLLCPHLPPVDVGALPEGPGAPSGLLALLALAAMLGEAASGAAIADPVLRRAFGVGARASMAELAIWEAKLDLAALPSPPAANAAAGLPAELRRSRKRYRAIVGMGLIAVADLARRLPGFAAASLPFLRESLLETGAHVTADDHAIQVVIERPRLDVLLSMTGLADREVALPDGRVLSLRRAP